MSDSVIFCIYYDSLSAVNTGPNIRVYLFLEKKKPIIELHLLQKALKTNNSILTEVHAVRKVFFRYDTDSICEIRYISCPHGQLFSFHNQTLKAAQ